MKQKSEMQQKKSVCGHMLRRAVVYTHACASRQIKLQRIICIVWSMFELTVDREARNAYPYLFIPIKHRLLNIHREYHYTHLVLKPESSN